MMKYKGTYILIGAAAGYISGGPIYHRNKAVYMHKKGWKVYYVSCSYGKVYVNGLEQFLVNPCTFITKFAYLYSGNKRNKQIDYIISLFPKLEGNVVIETGTDYTAYWGELLAERLKAKHIIVFLDEYNDYVTSKVASFYKFKFDRNELACIHATAMRKIFGSFWQINNENAVSLPCYCSNSLEDYHSEITNKIVRSKYNIGYIGRLEKTAVPELICGIKQFASEFPKDTISFICFGGGTEQLEREIVSSFSQYKNVEVYITGFVFPIPKEAVCKCDVFFSAAGSATVSLKAGVPTVRLDHYTNKPCGFLYDIENSRICKCSKGDSILDYLKWFFKEGYKPDSVPYSLSDEGEFMNRCFVKHDTFLGQSSRQLGYYDFSMIKLSFKEIILKNLISIVGNRYYKCFIPLISKDKHITGYI